MMCLLNKGLTKANDDLRQFIKKCLPKW